MRKKIIASYAVLIAILGISFTFIVRDALRDAMILQFEHNLTNEVKLVKALGVDRALEKEDFGAFAVEIKESIGVRVTIVDLEGLVLADTEEDPTVMMNHINREEIEKALQTQETALALRYSDTIQTDHLYAATPIEIDGDTYILRLSRPLYELKAFNTQIMNLAFILVGLVSLVAFVMAVWLVRKLTKPIYELTDAANRIAEGEYGRKIYTTSTDQIGTLTDAFNTMSFNLDLSIRELTRRNIELESILNSMINGIIAIDHNRKILMINKISFDILELPEDYVAENESMYKIVRNEEVSKMIEMAINHGISQTKELNYTHIDKILRIYVNPINTNEGKTIGSIVVFQDVTQIRKLEKVRSDFVSNVSHELKTPLTSIKGFVDTLKNGAIDDHDNALRFLDIIDIESERLYRLINDILLLSEIESMDQDLSKVTVDLCTVAEEVITMLEMKASEKGLYLKLEMCNEAFVSANRDRIKQMVINLVDNAIKYTESGGVLLSITKDAPFIKMVVSDTGIGFDDTHKERLFERFYRVDKGRSRVQGGTGLGLSIVKHIVLLYKGKILVNSTPGKGTEFEIYLPGNE
ncbi:HAMP domain-containing sensor histidine kinase [Fusibacter tunisiensis]|uniref:histidine kinase n=1 Tax=Fusibacter tunisiensis TaxID=1008308 RepID=A0ABS2MNV2_9FIRM|nr:ATP-binding protein [Fusibacter tunisiensis]MBM7561067.1 two-component system phosphate regulon sensor histidine kinase PhoR [Fusibacter tunisiensis]